MMRAISIEEARVIAERRGWKPARVKGTRGLQFTKGKNDRVEIISWKELENILRKEKLAIYESGGWMKIMKDRGKDVGRPSVLIRTIKKLEHDNTMLREDNDTARGEMEALKREHKTMMNRIKEYQKRNQLLSEENERLKIDLKYNLNPYGRINRCFKYGGSFCAKKIERDPNHVFIGRSYKPRYDTIFQEGVVPILRDLGLSPFEEFNVQHNIDLMCNICEGIQISQYAIVDISEDNPNVFLELGLLYGLGKLVLLLKEEGAEIVSDLRGIKYVSYNRPEDLREPIVNFFSRMGIKQRR